MSQYGAKDVTDACYEVHHFPPRMVTDLSEVMQIRKHIELHAGDPNA